MELGRCVCIERLHERIAHIFRHLLFRGNPDIMAGIGSQACQLHVSHNVGVAPGTSRVIRKTVQPNIKFPVTSFLFFMHALCAHAQIYR